MAGYMAARGDFNTEYDNYAELIVADIDFTEEWDAQGAGKHIWYTQTHWDIRIFHLSHTSSDVGWTTLVMWK